MQNPDSKAQLDGNPGVGCSAWLGGWLPVEQTKPETYSSVIVAGVLEDEEWTDSHEGFWCGRNWWSVRSRENDPLAKRRINNVTHWMRRPNPPNI
jgi:hypothetical protein